MNNHGGRRQPNGRYKYEQEDPYGRGGKRSPTFDTRAEGIAWAKACAKARRANRAIPEPDDFRERPQAARGVPFGEVGTAWLAWRKERPERRGGDRIHAEIRMIETYVINGKLAKVPVNELTEEHVEVILKQLRDEKRFRRPSLDVLGRCETVYDWAVKKQMCSAPNPFEGADPYPAEAEMRKQGKLAPDLISLDDMWLIAAHLPLLSAAKAWAQRLGSCRTGELHGILLGDVDWVTGVVWILGQAGKQYRIRRHDGTIERTDFKRKTKTSAGVRRIIFPRQLILVLRRHVEDVWGVDPIDGGFDPKAFLFVDDPKARPRQVLYYNHLQAVREKFTAFVEDHDPDDDEAGQAFRVAFNSDLRDDEVVTARQRNEVMGHRVQRQGSGDTPTNAARYSRGSRVPKYLPKIAAYYERRLDEMLGGRDLIPESDGPVTDDSVYTVRQASLAIHRSRTHVRRLIRSGVFSARRAPTRAGQTVAVIAAEEIDEYLAKRENRWTTRRAVDEFGMPQHTVQEWCVTRQVVATKVRGEYLIEEASLRARYEVWCRDQQLRRADYSLTNAAACLARPVSAIRDMVADGRLECAGVDSKGRVRVSQASVKRFKANEQRRYQNAR